VQKIVLIVGIMLLVLGIFISFSASNIMGEVQSVKNRYEPSDYDTVAHYVESMEKIWDIAYPVGIVGFVIFVIGLLLIILGIGLPKKIEKRIHNN